jgi:hypothetical protein
MSGRDGDDERGCARQREYAKERDHSDAGFPVEHCSCLLIGGLDFPEIVACREDRD